jgi:replicative DNA helicase
MVIFIHRYDYQGLSDNPDDIGRTQIIIAKHRNGAIADLDMRFRAEAVRFVAESESLVNQIGGMSYESAMNDDIPPFGQDTSGNDFGMNNDFM